MLRKTDILSPTSFFVHFNDFWIVLCEAPCTNQPERRCPLHANVDKNLDFELPYTEMDYLIGEKQSCHPLITVEAFCMQIDLAGKIDSCFCSLDNKIAHSFNSLDDKLETKFKYLDEGVTCTRETLQVRHEALSPLRRV
jgi:hypothetical protein